MSILRCRFVDNVAENRGPFVSPATARGGALWCDTETVEVRESLFEGNHAFYNGRPDPSLSKPEPGAQGGALFGPAFVSGARFRRNRASSDPATLIGRAEGGAVFGASTVEDCSFLGNEVDGVGPVPDVGPAAEAASLRCFELAGNLPEALPPLGPGCIVLDCDAPGVARRHGRFDFQRR